MIPRHTTMTWTQPIDSDSGQLAQSIDTTGVLLPDGHDPTDGHTYYRVSIDAVGTAPHPGVIMSVVLVSSGTVTISIHNGHNADAYFVTPATNTDLDAGQPNTGLWVGGVPAVPSDEAFITVPTPDPANPAKKTLTLGTNPYWQSGAVAQTIAEHVLTQVRTPIRDYAGTDIVPDPRVQTGDLLHIGDPDRSNVDEYVRAFGRHLDIEMPTGTDGTGTYSMALDIRPLGPPGAWLLGIPGRSELGATTFVY